MINPAPDQSSMYCGDMRLSDMEAPCENQLPIHLQFSLLRQDASEVDDAY
jgi:hypothetical protein